MKTISLFFVIFLTVLNGSCVSTKNWQSNEKPGALSASYKEFSGKGLVKKIKLDNKETIEMDCDIKNAGGVLTLQIKSKKDGILFRKRISGNTNETIKYTARQKDFLFVTVEGDKANGEYKLLYQITSVH